MMVDHASATRKQYPHRRLGGRDALSGQMARSPMSAGSPKQVDDHEEEERDSSRERSAKRKRRISFAGCPKLDDGVGPWPL